MKQFKIMASAALLLLTACGKKDKAFDATGTFEATEVTISAKATGELKSLDVTEGQTIDNGAMVGHIDTYQLVLKKQQLETQRSQLQASKRQLSSNQSATSSQQLDLNKQLSSVQQQIANARCERQRYSELVKDGAVPRKQLDDIDNQIKVLNRQLEATRDQLRSPRATSCAAAMPPWPSRARASAPRWTVSTPRWQASTRSSDNSTTRSPMPTSWLPWRERCLRSMSNRANT